MSPAFRKLEKKVKEGSIRKVSKAKFQTVRDREPQPGTSSATAKIVRTKALATMNASATHHRQTPGSATIVPTRGKASATKVSSSTRHQQTRASATIVHTGHTNESATIVSARRTRGKSNTSSKNGARITSDSESNVEDSDMSIESTTEPGRISLLISDLLKLISGKPTQVVISRITTKDIGDLKYDKKATIKRLTSLANRTVLEVRNRNRTTSAQTNRSALSTQQSEAAPNTPVRIATFRIHARMSTGGKQRKSRG